MARLRRNPVVLAVACAVTLSPHGHAGQTMTHPAPTRQIASTDFYSQMERRFEASHCLFTADGPQWVRLARTVDAAPGTPGRRAPW